MRRRDVLKGLLGFAAPAGLLTAGMACLELPRHRGKSSYALREALAMVGGRPVDLTRQVVMGVDHGVGPDSGTVVLYEQADGMWNVIDSIRVDGFRVLEPV